MSDAISNFRVFASRIKYGAQETFLPANKRIARLRLGTLQPEGDQILRELNSSGDRALHDNFYDVVHSSERARATSKAEDLQAVDAAVDNLHRGSSSNPNLHGLVLKARLAAEKFRSHAQTTVQRDNQLHAIATDALRSGKMVAQKNPGSLGSRPVYNDATIALEKLKREIGVPHYAGNAVTRHADVQPRIVALSNRLAQGQALGKIRTSIKQDAKGIIKSGSGDAVRMVEKFNTIENEYRESAPYMLARLDTNHLRPALQALKNSASRKIDHTAAVHGWQSMDPLPSQQNQGSALHHDANNVLNPTSFHSATHDLEQLNLAQALRTSHTANADAPPVLEGLDELQQRYNQLLKQQSAPRGNATNPPQPPNAPQPSAANQSAVPARAQRPNPLPQQPVGQAEAEPTASAQKHEEARTSPPPRPPRPSIGGLAPNETNPAAAGGSGHGGLSDTGNPFTNLRKQLLREDSGSQVESEAQQDLTRRRSDESLRDYYSQGANVAFWLDGGRSHANNGSANPSQTSYRDLPRRSSGNN